MLAGRSRIHVDVHVNSIKEFYLKRDIDETGISGVGVVGRGVVLPSGVAIMEWQTPSGSINIYRNLRQIEKVHGHGGKTVLVMGSPPAGTKKPKRGKKNALSKA